MLISRGCSALDPKHVAVQKAVLCLINAMFQKAEPQKKQIFRTTISSRQYRYIINHNILCQNQDGSNRDICDDPEMAHELYVLQQLLLNEYENKMRTSLDPSDNEATERIKVSHIQ